MTEKIIPHFGWEHNLLLSNDHIELIVTLDVGPRISSYRTLSGENVFFEKEDEQGGTGERDFKIRGGHRFWIAPEDEVRSYHADNSPVEYDKNSFNGEFVIHSQQTHAGKITKTLGITLHDDSSQISVRHTARNDGAEPATFGTWGSTAMAPGGLQIIPQPILGVHKHDLLPNRGIVLWPYTDLSDSRYHFGRDFFTLRQETTGGPTKIGFSHRERYVAYVLGNTLFVKAFDHLHGATYPDGGCNFETFTNSAMLVIEALGPLASVDPGESVSHTEEWYLFTIPAEAEIESEAALSAWLRPFLRQSGL